MHRSMPRFLPVYSSIQVVENTTFWHPTAVHLTLSNAALIAQLALFEYSIETTSYTWYFIPIHIALFILALCCNAIFGSIKCGKKESTSPLISGRALVVPVEYQVIISLQFIVCMLAQPIFNDGFDNLIAISMIGVEMINLYLIINMVCH
jgi:hypothetical protein